MIGQASLAIGSVIAFKTLPGCSSDDGTVDPQSPTPDPSDAQADSCPQCPDAGACPEAAACPEVPECPPAPDAAACPDAPECPACPDAGTTGAQVLDFPYEQHLAPTYRLDPAAVREMAYHYYYAGGCCHGAYRSLMEHLATTVGAPFNLLPLDFGKFGGGGIAGYGSICGSALGGILVINSIVANADARTAMLTDLMRWYERNAFPAYVPTAIDAGEHDLTKDFSAGNIVSLQVVPRSHLCHASVSTWCAVNGVSAGGADKKARCSRLTADVAGKVAEMLNAYLEAKAYTATAADSVTAGCSAGCHAPASTSRPVAAGMACDSCHADKLSGHP